MSILDLFRTNIRWKFVTNFNCLHKVQLIFLFQTLDSYKYTNINFCDIRMKVEKMFNLRREYILASSDHDVLYPANYLPITIRAQHHHVSRLQPLARSHYFSSFLLISPILQHCSVSSEPSFTGRTERYHLSIRIYNFYLLGKEQM